MSSDIIYLKQLAGRTWDWIDRSSEPVKAPPISGVAMYAHICNSSVNQRQGHSGSKTSFFFPLSRICTTEPFFSSGLHRGCKAKPYLYKLFPSIFFLVNEQIKKKKKDGNFFCLP